MQGGSLLGNEFGNYQLVAEIARGGFGTVYQARHLILKERVVAIKVLHNLHLASAYEREAFLREAQILEKLKHPFILPVLDVGMQQGIPFIVTEYAARGSLQQRIQTYGSRPFPFAEAISILSQIGQALSYAHRQGIIHRDLKPANILFNAQGDALLADFGVATILATTSIRNTSVTGTPTYMAPEQFQGQVSRESDQYSLGCIAYEIFTGQKPFDASDFIALGFKHVTEPPVSPRQLNPQIPVQVEQAILTALEKKRDYRYPNIAAFITALQVPIPSQSATKAPAPVPAPMPVPAPVSMTRTPLVLGSFSTPREADANKVSQSQKAVQTPVSHTASLEKPGGYTRFWAALGYFAPLILILVSSITPSTAFTTIVIWLALMLMIYLVGRRRDFIRFHLMHSFLLFWLMIFIIFIATFIEIQHIAGISFDEGGVVNILFFAYALTAVILGILVTCGKYASLPVLGRLARNFANRAHKGQ